MTFARFLITLTALTVPAFAGIAGRWDATSTTPDGEKIKTLLVVTENAGKVEATLSLGEQKLPVSNVAFAGDQLSLRLMWGETGVNLKAKLDGDKLAGTWVADSGDTGPITAVRLVDAAAAGSNTFYTGKWKLTAARPQGDPIKVDLDLKEEAGKWSGSLVTPDGMQIPAVVAMENGNLTITIDAGNAVYTLKLAKDGEGMKGTAAGPDGAIPLTAVR
jgi:hypothetical protein